MNMAVMSVGTNSEKKMAEMKSKIKTPFFQNRVDCS